MGPFGRGLVTSDISSARGTPLGSGVGNRAGKARAAVMLSWMLASAVFRPCDRVLPDADWAEQLLYSNCKTYEFAIVA